MKIYTINDWKQTQKQTTSRAANLCASSTLCSARGWSLCLNSGTVESGNRAWIFRDLKSYRRSTEFIEDTDIFPILLIILLTKSYWTIFNHMQSWVHATTVATIWHKKLSPVAIPQNIVLTLYFDSKGHFFLFFV